jgi:hypothetical protein
MSRVETFREADVMVAKDSAANPAALNIRGSMAESDGHRSQIIDSKGMWWLMLKRFRLGLDDSSSNRATQSGGGELPAELVRRAARRKLDRGTEEKYKSNKEGTEVKE